MSVNIHVTIDLAGSVLTGDLLARMKALGRAAAATGEVGPERFTAAAAAAAAGGAASAAKTRLNDPPAMTGRDVTVALYQPRFDAPWVAAAVARLDGGGLQIVAHADPLAVLAAVGASGGRIVRVVMDRWSGCELGVEFLRLGVPVAHIGLGFVSLAAASRRLSEGALQGNLHGLDAATDAMLKAGPWDDGAAGARKPGQGCPPLLLAMTMATAAVLADQP